MRRGRAGFSSRAGWVRCLRRNVQMTVASGTGNLAYLTRPFTAFMLYEFHAFRIPYPTATDSPRAPRAAEAGDQGWTRFPTK